MSKEQTPTPQDQQAEGWPVAWMTRGPNGQVIGYSATRKPGDDSGFFDVQPLYAHPAPQAEAAPSRDEGLRAALVLLEKAGSEVSRRGAETGPQWSKLSFALLKARAALEDRT